MILSVLPNEGDILTLRVIREAIEVLAIKSEELEAVKLRQTESQYIWDETKDLPVEIKLSKIAIGLIRDRVKDLSEQKKLKLQYLDLYDMFVDGQELLDSPKQSSEERPKCSKEE
jgi:hypothetical protein